MISRIRGIMIEKTPPRLVIEASNGVSYELEVSMTSFYRLPELGQQVILETHLVVREDAHLLYGFSQAEERTLFRALIKVNGIGPKVALSILSSMEPDAFVACITQDNKYALERIPGIGKRTAERLIVEMRDKLSEWKIDSETVFSGNNAELITDKIIQEAVSALVSLGYKSPEARRAVIESAKENNSIEYIIRHALRNMSK